MTHPPCRHALVAVVPAALACWPAAAATAEPLGPVLYERFENRTEGTARGGVSWVTEVVPYGGLVVPNLAAARFDGAPGTGVAYGLDVRAPGPAFTVEAFIRPDALPSYAAIAADWNEDGDNRAWAFVLLASGALRFDVSPDGRFYGENKLQARPRLVRAGTWYHVAAVCEPEASRIYVNGREVAAGPRGKPGLTATARTGLTIGTATRYATEGPRPFHGLIDEVRISPRALRPEEFLQTREPLPEPAGPAPASFELPFLARERAEAEAWQQRTRGRLLELVGRQEPRRPPGSAPADLRLDSSSATPAYTLSKATFASQDGTRRPCLLAVPPGPGPFPAMLCLHGHGGTAEAVFDPATPYHGFADRFARGGYVVLAPSLPHGTYCATRLWDLFGCVDILAARPEVDPARLGVAGLSMGGEWSMWIMACDTRLKTAVVSGWLCTTEGVYSVPNCSCWELPGLPELTDICDVHLLAAPRPVLFESAEQDGCFPLRYTREAFARVRAGYRLFGAESAVAQDTWPSGHEWHGLTAYPFVDRVLGGHAATAGAPAPAAPP